MCTLILGLGILGPGSLLLGANRDESPDRPSSDPSMLNERPWVVGGRDLVSGGTWLAVREARFVTALMNRRPVPGDERDVTTLRSRGLLCLDVACAGEKGPSFLDRALALVRRDSYAHCTLVGVGVNGEAWALHAGAGGGAGGGAARGAGGGGSRGPGSSTGGAAARTAPGAGGAAVSCSGEPSTTPIARGWHVITHQDLDDPTEPRTKWLMDRLTGVMPRSVDEAVELLKKLLRVHGEEGGAPAVCLHRDIFPTVSSSILALDAAGGGRYLHSPGPPCTTEYRDFTPILAQRRKPK
ncbi:MAG: NRDE family protein [Candidatus Latescibacteria bacterium]|nr:NRDE family protein [Candidatus Latescibacterota bacterium]